MESDVAKRSIVCEKFGYPINIGEWHPTRDGVLVMVLGDVRQVLHAHARVLKELGYFLQAARNYVSIIPAIISM